ncbi:Halomucin [Frankliniella fusca]|uniref:Halomucin n=1 Tax=Frankliniella fusca TaxID=407009 RepID=A0AAE1HWF4_9NEOP|nr:Halomucin [Frankliniella fusca]
MAAPPDIRQRRRRAAAEVERQLELEALRVENENESSDANEQGSSDSLSDADDEESSDNSHRDDDSEGRVNDSEAGHDGFDDHEEGGAGAEEAQGDNENNDHENNDLRGNEDGSDDDGNVFELIPCNGAPQNVPHEENLLNNFKRWGQRGVSFKKVDELLHILHPLHPDLPLCSKTLLGTPRRSELRNLGNGLFWYKGILTNLEQRVDRQYLYQQNNELLMDVNIDGLDPFSSSELAIWPILGRLYNQKEPFIIAAYCGKEKLSRNELGGFLDEYVDEVSRYIRDGVRLFDQNVSFGIRHYILDAQARALVKCIIGHNGIFGCEKCETQGIWFMNRTVFLDMDAPLRSDQSFSNRSNPRHHTGQSPLEQIPTNMISSFRLDSMHLVAAGVKKRWLKFVLGVPNKRRGKLREAEVLELNAKILRLAIHVPSNFNRRPRTFKNYARFKCTELRRILLYDGLAIFRGCDYHLWKSYVLLQCGIYILSSPSLVQTMTDVANVILRQFVTHAQTYFGPQFVVYNVHSLAHLADECREHGTLDSFSAYPFESYLGVIKELLRSYNKPLHQIFNRDHERDGHLIQSVPEDNADITLINQRHDYEDEVEGVYYAKIKFCQTVLAVNEADCCFESTDGHILVLANIVYTPAGRVVFICHKFLLLDDYYTYPLKSSSIGIFKVGELDAAKTIIDSSKFLRKHVLFPIGADMHVSIPLLHTEGN